MLFARSVRRNILYGLEEEDGTPSEQMPSNEDVEEAARLANAHGFIMAMPQGYDTVCLLIEPSYAANALWEVALLTRVHVQPCHHEDSLSASRFQYSRPIQL